MEYPIILHPYEILIPNDLEVNDIVKREYYKAFWEEANRKYKKINFKTLHKPVKPIFKSITLNGLFEKPLLLLFSILFWFFTIPMLLCLLINDYIDFRKEMTEYNNAQSYYDNNIYLTNKNNEKYYEIEKLKKTEVNNLMKQFSNDLIKDIQNKRKEIFEQRLKESIINIKKISIVNLFHKKGISENFFYNQISNASEINDFKIITNASLSSFTPDFIFEHKSGLIFDVEIDEPYVGFSKEVIHYFDENVNEFSDEYRNNYFINKGWIIVRFSEKQIINNPLGCVKLIVEIAHCILNMELNKIPNLNIVEKEKVWTKKVADEMALFNYRNTYLPDDILNLFK